MDSERRNERLTAEGDDDFRSFQQKYLMQCWAAQRHYDPVAVEKADGGYIGGQHRMALS